MSDPAVSEARKALGRLRRAAEKAQRELGALKGVLARAEADDFPHEAHAVVCTRLQEVIDFVDDEERRLREKILSAGGLEPGRVRRSGGA